MELEPPPDVPDVAMCWPAGQVVGPDDDDDDGGGGGGGPGHSLTA